MVSQFQNAVHYFRKITFRKAWNYLQISWSYYLSTIIKKAIVCGRPYSITIEPTTNCNLRCPECPSGLRSFSRPTGNIELALYQQTIDQVADTCLNLFLYFQGEPFLHPAFMQLVNYAQQKNIYTTTSTNGHFLTKTMAEKIVKSGLDRLIISIDGTTQQTYAQYRKSGDLKTVLQGTENVIAAKKRLNSPTPFVVIQFLVVKPNEHQIPEIRKLAHQIGADYLSLKSAQIYNYQKGSPLIPNNPKYSRYRQQTDGTYRIKSKLPNTCARLWNSSVVSWDGKILPCCFDKDAQHVMGQSGVFAQTWKSDNYTHFRQQILHGRKKIAICQNCTEGLTLNDTF